MERLKQATQKLQELKSTTGKNDKLEVLRKYKDDADFRTLLLYRLNPMYSYKIKKFEEYRMLEPTTTFDDVISLLDILRSSNINDKLRQKALNVLSHTHPDVVEVVEGIITKQLALGVDTAVNKAFGYTFIPTFKCGLASPLDEKVKFKFPAIVEKKEDGVRCLAVIKDNKCTLFTRQGRELHFPQIEKACLEVANGEDLTFDGELITEQRTVISGICNKNLKSGYQPNSDDIITYSTFDELPTDVFLTQGKSNPQYERTLSLQKRVIFTKSLHIKTTESRLATSMRQVKQFNEEIINAGGEGVIIKDRNAPYNFKRTKAWIKMKAVNSCSLRVVGVVNGKGKRAGQVGSLVCESADGRIKVNVGSGLSDEHVKMFTKTPPIGKIIEVTFNVLIKGRDSDTYSLFLPRYDQMRVDLDDADTLEKVISQHIGRIEE